MKIKNWISFIILMVLMASFSQASVIDPSKLGLGARSVSMGRCAAAVELDPNGAFINPALGAELKTWGAQSMLVNLSEDIAYNQLSFALPETWGTIGLSYLGATSGGIIGTTVEAGRVVPSGFTFDYSNALYTLMYGNKYSEDILYGANIKYFQKSFSSVASGYGYDLDLGLLWKPNPKLRVGVAQQNTIPAPIAAMHWDTNAEEGIPFNTKIGVGYRALDELLLAADMDYAQNRPILFHGGLEWGPLWKMLYIRGGIDQYAENTTNAVTNFTAGLGVSVAGISFDYAYYMDTLLQSNAAHYVSFRYSPPTTSEVKEVKKAMGLPVTPEVKPVEAPKLVLITFRDVPAGSFARDEINLLATAKVMSGFPDETFRPKNKLTRAEMSKLLSTLSDSQLDLTYYKRVFKDLKKGAWYTPYVLNAYDNGWLKGYPNGTFKPNQALTRAETVGLLVKFSGILPPEQIFRKPFEDVSLRHWAAKSIYIAKDSGWLDYLGQGAFKPNLPITRAEAAYLISKTTAGMKKIYEVKKDLSL